jgi:hypothetical protein
MPIMLFLMLHYNAAIVQKQKQHAEAAEILPENEV